MAGGLSPPSRSLIAKAATTRLGKYVTPPSVHCNPLSKVLNIPGTLPSRVLSVTSPSRSTEGSVGRSVGFRGNDVVSDVNVLSIVRGR